MKLFFERPSDEKYFHEESPNTVNCMRKFTNCDRAEREEINGPMNSDCFKMHLAYSRLQYKLLRSIKNQLLVTSTCFACG